MFWYKAQLEIEIYYYMPVKNLPSVNNDPRFNF